MKHAQINILALLILVFAQSCNTLYNTKSIQVETLEPGRVMLPEGYTKLAFRYNNTNVSYNPDYAFYFKDKVKLTDSTNLDSIASWIYYDYVVNSLADNGNLDKLTIISAGDYSNTNIVDSLPMPDFLKNLTDSVTHDQQGRLVSYILSIYLKYNPITKKEGAAIKKLDKEFALYTKNELKTISDSTGADLLLSLDHFFTSNAISHTSDKEMAQEMVSVNTFWTFYDLRQQILLTYFNKSDTVSWWNYTTFDLPKLRMVPTRFDAVLNASDIAGTNFAEYLLPHWIAVERFYYRSGHVELKKTDKLVEEGKWLEAAKIWKAEVNNKNKLIAAKSMFNLALANEMEGNYTSALDWVVRSYHVFGEKNDHHSENCRNYIRVLGKRQLDKKMLDQFYVPEHEQK